MKQAATQSLFAYWETLRAGRAAPERNLIDPAAIRGCLADTFMLELEAGPALLMNLTGTRLNALFGRDLKGADFLSLWAVGSRADIGGLTRSVMGQACVLVAGARGGAAAGESSDLELLLLPLRHHGKTHARMLGLLAPLRAPVWFSLLPLNELTLTSWRLHGQEALGAALSADETQYRGRPAPPLRRAGEARAALAPARARRHGHLFVHDGGRGEVIGSARGAKLSPD